MRKDLDLEMDARIQVEYEIEDERVAELVEEREDLIAEEVRADAFGRVEDGYRKEWELEGIDVEIAVEKV